MFIYSTYIILSSCFVVDMYYPILSDNVEPDIIYWVITRDFVIIVSVSSEISEEPVHVSNKARAFTSSIHKGWT